MGLPAGTGLKPGLVQILNLKVTLSKPKVCFGMLEVTLGNPEARQSKPDVNLESLAHNLSRPEVNLLDLNKAWVHLGQPQVDSSHLWSLLKAAWQTQA